MKAKHNLIAGLHRFVQDHFFILRLPAGTIVPPGTVPVPARTGTIVRSTTIDVVEAGLNDDGTGTVEDL